MDPISNDRKSMNIYQNIAGSKDSLSFSIQDTGMMINKGGLSFTPDNSLLAASKDKSSMSITNQLWINKDSNKTTLSNEMVKSNKVTLNSYVDKQTMIDKENYYSSVFQQGQDIIKNMISLSDVKFDTVIKNDIPTDYVNILVNDYAGMIIPISKVKQQGYIDHIDHMIQKVSGTGYINQDITASKMSSSGFLPSLDLFCDKKEFKSYIDYKNTQISKSKMHSMISKDTLVKKNHVYGNLNSDLLWANKHSYGTVESSFWAKKSSSESLLTEQLQVQKKAIKGHIDNILNAIASMENLQTSNKLFVDKNEQICYYDYNMTWADKKGLDTLLNKQMIVDKQEQKTHLLDCVSPVIKSKVDTYYDYVIFATRPIRESGIYNQMIDMNKTYYSLNIPPEDFGNWAWVYETPDPIEKGYGIDELLLPENDTRYENFKDIIFDK
jgi:hypothetical protein